jgi:hypothetical protein
LRRAAAEKSEGESHDSAATIQSEFHARAQSGQALKLIPRDPNGDVVQQAVSKRSAPRPRAKVLKPLVPSPFCALALKGCFFLLPNVRRMALMTRILYRC